MPRDAFKFKGAGSKPVLGGFITFDSMPMVEILAGIGFDYLAIDTQHAMLDVVMAGRLMYAIPTEMPVLVRVGNTDGSLIGKALDSGADGVIVPMVETREQAAAAVAACKYNPAGNRSFGPVRKHLGFDAKEIMERAACFVMIETAKAVENIDEIVTTPGVTGVYFGSGDLAVNLGLHPLEPHHPKIREATKRVADACQRAGVVAGMHGQTPEHIRDVIEQGFTMVTLSGDRTYIARGAGDMLKAGRAVR
ncbi:HpcH/HpaI aldolase family protein [Ramlibacter sp.]|uniref:HpcH/HpaI aldolase family protein n=1 Tax=Ramlibacter sp. TaxID=1917967 RepID=UPI003D0AB94C